MSDVKRAPRDQDGICREVGAELASRYPGTEWNKVPEQTMMALMLNIAIEKIGESRGGFERSTLTPLGATTNVVPLRPASTISPTDIGGADAAGA